MPTTDATSAKWDSVFDTLETIGRVEQLWLPGNLVVAGTLQAAGLLRRHLPRLLAQISQKPGASAEIQRDLRTMESQVSREGTVSTELVARLQAQARQLTTLADRPTALRGPTDADDLANFFEIGESSDVREVCLKLQNAEALRGFRAQWLRPSTLLLGGAFRGEIQLARLLPGSGWQKQVRFYVHSVHADNEGTVTLLLDDRARLPSGRPEILRLEESTVPTIITDRQGVSRCTVVPFALPNPVRLISGHAKLTLPRRTIKGWGVRVSTISESNDGLTIFHLQPR